MHEEELPIPEGERALDDEVSEMEAQKEEDEVDGPEGGVDDPDAHDFIGDTNVPNEDLTPVDLEDLPKDEGDDELGDWDDGMGGSLIHMSFASKTAKQRSRIRRLSVRAAILGLHHASSIHYTQGALRWQGIAEKLVAAKGQFPNYADCSAFVTWCLWNGLYVPYHLGDTVNGANWQAGFTGTMLGHGRPIRSIKNVRWGDAVIYGVGGTSGRHTAIIVKVGNPRGSKVMVVSHGSEGGPYYLPYNYRRDIQSVRRYIG